MTPAPALDLTTSLRGDLSPNPCLMWLHYIWYRNTIRHKINAVPTLTLAWTRAWLLQGGLNWSGVDPPLSSSRACLTTFIAFSVP